MLYGAQLLQQRLQDISSEKLTASNNQRVVRSNRSIHSERATLTKSQTIVFCVHWLAIRQNAFSAGPSHCDILAYSCY